MNIGIKELTENLPKAIEAAGGASPDWLTRAESIVNGIKDMIKFYNQLQDKNKPVAPKERTEATLSFSEARELKKAEMAGKAVTQPMANNEFKDVLEGLVKAVNTLEGMGHGEKPIGQVIMAAPFTVAQVKAFLKEQGVEKC